MRLRTLLAATVPPLTLVVGTLGLASSATAATLPVVVSPAPGGTLAVGSTGPLVIDFPVTGAYHVSVSCGTPGDGGYFWSTYGTQSSGRQSIAIDPLLGIGKELSGSTCEISAYGAAPGIARSIFTVVGSSTPVVVSPASGGTVPVGWTGPLVIDFPLPDKYTVSVACGPPGDRGYFWWNGGSQPYSGRQSIAIDPLVGIGKELSGSTCQVEVSGWNFKTFSSPFTAVAPPLKLGDVRASESTFYPLVKDGYRDKTQFLFNVNRYFKATLTIKDARGRTVFTEQPRGYSEPGKYKWGWSGDTTHGKPVLPGKYQATINVTDTDGSTRTTSTSVRVDTKTVTRKKTVRLDGNRGRTSTSGNCDARKTQDGTVVLDCRGGAYAAATFEVEIPADARDIRWGATTARTDEDLCCRGTVTKRGTRVGKTRYRVRVQVTGQRAVEVSEAWVSYRGTYQI